MTPERVRGGPLPAEHRGGRHHAQAGRRQPQVSALVRMINIYTDATLLFSALPNPKPVVGNLLKVQGTILLMGKIRSK